MAPQEIIRYCNQRVKLGSSKMTPQKPKTDEREVGQMIRLDQAGIDRIVRQELAYQRLETRIAELRELLYGNLKPDIETPKPVFNAKEVMEATKRKMKRFEIL